MPLNLDPKLPWHHGYTREEVLGTCPDNLFEVLAYLASPDVCRRQDPQNMSVQQKAAAFDLLMHSYQRSRTPGSFDDMCSRYQHILAKKDDRRAHAFFSDAILDGVVALKERTEDRLVCTIEVDFDRVNKQRPGQTHEDLIPAITWQLPQLLRDNPLVEQAFTSLEKRLAKAVVPLTNELPVRRKYGPELTRKVCDFFLFQATITHYIPVSPIQGRYKCPRQ